MSVLTGSTKAHPKRYMSKALSSIRRSAEKFSEEFD